VDDLIAELLAERFGRGVPWREVTAGHNPTPDPGRERDDELTCARRRRALLAALDDRIPGYRPGRRVA
jgi:hypothetical protein